MSATRALCERVAGREPRYVRGTRPNEHWAHFPSGAVIWAEQGRARRYPGLEGPALPTLGLYRQCLAQADTSGTIVDLGSGCGAGTRILSAAFADVLGVDVDRRAIAFAREYHPDARYRLGDAAEDLPVKDLAGAVAVDVLCHVVSPLRVLTALHARATAGLWLHVAEPAVSAKQHLLYPARRAFSQQGLCSLLVRADFDVDSCTTANGFWVARARSSGTRAWRHLLRAGLLIRRGQPGPAHALLDTLSRTPGAALRLETALLQAAALLATGSAREAEPVFEELGARYPNDARPIVGLAHTALLRDDPDRALQLARRAVLVDPGEGSAAQVLARTASLLGDEGALEAWQRYSDLLPDNEEAAQGFAAALRARGDEVGAHHALARKGRYDRSTPG